MRNILDLSRVGWLLLLVVSLLGGAFWACEPEEGQLGEYALIVAPVAPQDVEPLDIESLDIEIRNVRTGGVYRGRSEYCQKVRFQLPMGTYSIRLTGSRELRTVVQRFAFYNPSYAFLGGDGELQAQLTKSTSQKAVDGEGEPRRVEVQLRAPKDAMQISLRGIHVAAKSRSRGEEVVLDADENGRVEFSLRPGSYVLTARGKSQLLSGASVDVYAIPEELALRDADASVELQLKSHTVSSRDETALQVVLDFDERQPLPQTRSCEVVLQRVVDGQEIKANTDSKGELSVVLPQGVYYASARYEGLDESGLRRCSFASETLEVQHVAGAGTTTLHMGAPEVVAAIVIKEIYYARSRTCGSKQRYDDDAYIELYNNSDRELNVDGLSICCTYSNTMLDRSANFFSQYLGTDIVVPGFIFSIPSNGTPHTLAPGKTLLFADKGMNHRKVNPCSPADLSDADWEWYDKDRRDVDIPSVPNLDKWFSYSATVTALHVRGYWGIHIMKADAPMQAFLDRYLVQTTYPSGRAASIYAIPSRYIIDGVQCAAPQGPKSLVYPSNVDAGYTYCSETFSGKCVKRKVKGKVGDRFVLVDTNNSTQDFSPDAIPSPRIVQP